MTRHPLVILLTVTVLFSASGATCLQRLTTPRTLSPTPTLAEVTQTVNANSGKVQSVYATNAALSAPLTPSIRANIALERPRHFRLTGETAFSGPEVDLGSNDEWFWFWVRRSQPPAMYTCRHDRLAQSPLRQVMPVSIDWLQEAFGLATFDPAERHEGPYPVRGGKLEIRTRRPSPEGELTRVLVIDDWTARVLEVHLYDARQQRIATALLSNHHFDPVTQTTLPRRIEIQWPGQQFNLKIDLREMQVNTINGGSPQLWAIPQYDGFATVDLSQSAPSPLSAAPPPPTAQGELLTPIRRLPPLASP